jgi:hypothetical protein
MHVRLVTALAALAVAVIGLAVWQARYDVDSRYFEVRVGEVQSGQDGTATFRHCVPASGRVSTVYTTGVYGVRLRATRSEAAVVRNCIRSSPNVRYVASTQPPPSSLGGRG